MMLLVTNFVEILEPFSSGDKYHSKSLICRNKLANCEAQSSSTICTFTYKTYDQIF